MTAAAAGNGDGAAEFVLDTDARGLAEMATGASPARLMLSRRVRVRGRRRRALKLRAMGEGPDPTIEEALAHGAQLDADAVFRSLAYLIDPAWTRGHAFTVEYDVDGGRWFVEARDGEPVRVTREPRSADSSLRLSMGTYRRLVAGELTPNEAMRSQLIDIVGELHPITLVGRWIDRAQGRDDRELEREERQRAVQERRTGSWGGAVHGRPLPAAGRWPRPTAATPRTRTRATRAAAAT